MNAHSENLLEQLNRQAAPFATSRVMNDTDALGMLLRAAQVTPADAVLDVACGPGIVACAFGAVAQSVMGIDLAPAMLERARERAADRRLTNVTFTRAEATTLPFADTTFSIVVSRFAFHHFPEPRRVMAEMTRVCRPGGMIVVADTFAADNPQQAEAFHQMEILRDPSHVRTLPLAELRALFRTAGLEVCTETAWNFEVDLERLLEGSFPAAGAEKTLRRIFAEAISGDTLGLAPRMQLGRVLLTYRSMICAARKPA